MAKLYNLARMTTATTGTGTITLGAAVSGYLTFSGAGAADGDVLGYAIKDGVNSEIGTGTYSLSGTTLTRAVITSTNSNAAISLSGAAEVFITASNHDFFAPGTLMLFQQTTAPAGWTKQTTHNDKLLRVVSGTASSGGTNAFSTVNAQTVVGSSTLSSAQLAAHTHPPNFGTGYLEFNPSGGNGTWNGGPGMSVVSVAPNTGSGSAHSHAITMSILYVDLIIATKD